MKNITLARHCAIAILFQTRPRASVRFQSFSLRIGSGTYFTRPPRVYVFMEQCFLRARKLDSKLARCRALFITFVPAVAILDHREKKIPRAGPKITALPDAFGHPQTSTSSLFVSTNAIDVFLTQVLPINDARCAERKSLITSHNRDYARFATR